MPTLCRTCGQEAEHAKGLFDKQGSDILGNIFKLTGIRLTDHPGVPTKICLSCLLDLNDAITFRERCIKTNVSWFEDEDQPQEEIYISDEEDISHQEKSVEILPKKTVPIKIVPIKTVPNNVVSISIFPINNVTVGQTQKVIKQATIPRQGDKKLDKIPKNLSSDLVVPLSREDPLQVMNELLISDKDPEESIIQENLVVENINPKTKTRKSKIQPVIEKRPPSKRKKPETSEAQSKNFTEKKPSQESDRKERSARHMNVKMKELLLAEDSDEAPPVTTKKTQADKCATRNKGNAVDKKLHFCDQCGKSFAEKSNFNVHMKRHTGTREFQCQECDRKEFTQHLLNLHVRIRHRGELPYVCKYCGQRFNNCLKRLTHERNHKESPVHRPHVCPICKKAFKNSQTLKNHSVVHTGEQPFHCELCQTSFNRRNALATHKKSKHHRLKLEQQAEKLNS
ncbi:transcription factor Ouib-like [Drosophila takahashii]|uniref:transcription factor Ouib-like n=1 Tax=Drosophila takahashii TaxID=29030 RepID=UPI001CF7EFE8|nr:transcription factor Ouib-like [Drosophila takahashii]